MYFVRVVLVSTFLVTVYGAAAGASNFSEHLKSFEVEGYQLLAPIVSEPMKSGEVTTVAVPMLEKHEYNLLFLCTGECERLSVGVADSTGAEVLPVFQDKSLTFAFVEPTASGTHTVFVSGSPCPATTCRVQFAAVGRGMTTPTSPQLAPPSQAAPTTSVADPRPQEPRVTPTAQSSIDLATAETLIGRIVGDVAIAIMSAAEAESTRERASLQPLDRVPQPARRPSEAPGKAPDVAFGQTSARPGSAQVPAAAPLPRRSTVDCDALHQQTMRQIWAIQPGPGSYETAQTLAQKLKARCPGY